MEASQQVPRVTRFREPTWWEDIVMWGLIGPIGGIVLAVALLFGVAFYVDTQQSQSLSYAAIPEEFDQEFFSWAYSQNGFTFKEACNWAGGIVLKDDGQCYDSETIRVPYLRPSR